MREHKKPWCGALPRTAVCVVEPSGYSSLAGSSSRGTGQRPNNRLVTLR
jgi:hypothetical protein